MLGKSLVWTLVFATINIANLGALDQTDHTKAKKDVLYSMGVWGALVPKNLDFNISGKQ